MLVPFSQILEKNPLKLRDLEEVEELWGGFGVAAGQLPGENLTAIGLDL